MRLSYCLWWTPLGNGFSHFKLWSPRMSSKCSRFNYLFSSLQSDQSYQYLLSSQIILVEFAFWMCYIKRTFMISRFFFPQDELGFYRSAPPIPCQIWMQALQGPKRWGNWNVSTNPNSGIYKYSCQDVVLKIYRRRSCERQNEGRPNITRGCVRCICAGGEERPKRLSQQ